MKKINKKKKTKKNQESKISKVIKNKIYYTLFFDKSLYK
jgi:hypothetical protein